jgi:hypothetical protein
MVMVVVVVVVVGGGGGGGGGMVVIGGVFILETCRNCSDGGRRVKILVVTSVGIVVIMGDV